MAWITLVLAGLFEVAWAIGLKYSDGFTRPWPSVWTIAAMLVSFGLLSLSMKTLPVGVAYSAWVGIGAVGSVILGVALFDEPMTLARGACLALIVAGVLGLKLA